MNNKFWSRRFIISLLTVFYIAPIMASPVWTFTPLTPTSITIPSNGTAMVKYLVTNQSNKPHTLVMSPIVGVTQITSGVGLCGSVFSLPTRGSSCTLSLTIDGSLLQNNIHAGPKVCQQGGGENQCYQPGKDDILNITVGSPIVVSLTAVSPTSGAASGGTGVILTGTRLASATSVTFGGLPATNVNPINETTVLTVTPAHVIGPVDVEVTTPDGSAMLSNGYTYLTTSVGQPSGGGIIACLNAGNNLIAATADNSDGIIWGIDGTTNAQSITDGATNTSTIVSVLGAGNYAAQVCNDYEVDSQGNTPCQAGNACYNDWFLPAGHNKNPDGQLNCLHVNRMAIGGFVLAGYWSSSEYASLPLSINSAYEQTFNNAGTEVATAKGYNIPPLIRVRCVRTFSP